MQGIGIKSLKKNPALIPLYLCVSVGAAGAIFTMIRTATRSPDVAWNRKKNPEPWQEYKDKRYKLYSPVKDYSNVKSPAPDYNE